MIRRIPVLSTLLVLVAVGIMVRLGIWQLDRLQQKEALLARYAAARAISADVPFPQTAKAAGEGLYRHSTIECFRVTAESAVAGRSANGASGLAQTAKCELAGGGSALVVLGWSKAPGSTGWRGGVVQGIVAPGPRLIADPPVAGLAANAVPDPGDIPNNHFAYAVQWFLFAGVALVIYALALRKRLRGQ